MEYLYYEQINSLQILYELMLLGSCVTIKQMQLNYTVFQRPYILNEKWKGENSVCIEVVLFGSVKSVSW